MKVFVVLSCIVALAVAKPEPQGYNYNQPQNHASAGSHSSGSFVSGILLIFFLKFIFRVNFCKEMRKFDPIND